jgi:hypothetical protein
MPMSVTHTRVAWFENVRTLRLLVRVPPAALRIVKIIGLGRWAPPIQLRIASTALTRPSTVTPFQDAAVRLQTNVVLRTVKYVSNERPRCRAN